MIEQAFTTEFAEKSLLSFCVLVSDIVGPYVEIEKNLSGVIGLHNNGTLFPDKPDYLFSTQPGYSQLLSPDARI